jgi:hypothetical protein
MKLDVGGYERSGQNLEYSEGEAQTKYTIKGVNALN